jgi:hypothetical protein
VAFPTLQSHTRNSPFRLFPLELSLQGIPGYHRIGRSGARVVVRRDLALPMGEPFWLHGGTEVEIWIETFEPVERMAFLVANPVPGNAIELSMGEARERLELKQGESRMVILQPGAPDKASWTRGQRYHAYRLSVRTTRGTNRTWTVEVAPPPCTWFAFNPKLVEDFFTGAELTYLGPAAGLEKNVYALEWVFARVSPRVRVGETFEIGVKLINRSRETWPNEGAARVALSYHWLDAAGRRVVWDGERTDLPRPVPPGEPVTTRQAVKAPAVPGTYTLVLDPVFEQVAWFSDKNGGKVVRAVVEVVGE